MDTDWPFFGSTENAPPSGTLIGSSVEGVYLPSFS